MLKVNIKKSNVLIERFPIPISKNNESLVYIEYCGICGTDYQKYLNFENENEWGHEIIGRIVGKNGDLLNRVVIRTSFPCNSCVSCLDNNLSKCLNWKRAPINGFSEYITIDKQCIIPIETNSEGLEYALVEPLYIASRLVEKIMPTQNDSFGIIGNGTISILSAFYLWVNGYKKINVYARNINGVRSKFLNSLGINVCKYTDIEKSDFKAITKIINTAPYKTMAYIIENANNHAIITFNGISDKNIVELDLATWHFKNLVIVPSFPHPQVDFAECIKIIDKYGKILNNLITHIFPIKETSKAFKLMKNKEIDYIKVLIKIGK